MRAFNSFQIVALFSGLPFLISWLSEATFRYHTAAFWTTIAIYFIGACCMTVAVYDSMREDGPLDW